MSAKSKTPPQAYVADNIGRLQNESTVMCMTFWRSLRDNNMTDAELRELFLSLVKMEKEIEAAKGSIAEMLYKKPQIN